METIGKQPYLLQPTTKPVFLDIKKPHVKMNKPDTMNEPSFPKQSQYCNQLQNYIVVQVHVCTYVATTETEVATNSGDKSKKPEI